MSAVAATPAGKRLPPRSGVRERERLETTARPRGAMTPRNSGGRGKRFRWPRAKSDAFQRERAERAGKGKKEIPLKKIPSVTLLCVTYLTPSPATPGRPAGSSRVNNGARLTCARNQVFSHTGAAPLDRGRMHNTMTLLSTILKQC